jgi:hypothetical protein
VPTLRSEYGFDQFETVLQKFAHEIAIDAVTNLKQGRVRIEISSGNKFQRVETDKYSISFYANHIGFSRHTNREYLGFDVEEKEYNTSNHRTKISFFVQVEGKYDKGEYVEIGRPEKERKRSEEILTFIHELMAEAGIKPIPRFTLKGRVRSGDEERHA